MIAFALKHWRSLVLAGLLLAGAIALLAWDARRIEAVRTTAYAAGQAEVQGRWDQERIEQQALALLAEQQEREKEQRRTEAERKQNELDAKEKADLQRAAARSDAVSGRLRQRTAELEQRVAAAAHRACEDPAAATEREAASAAADLLAELRRRTDAAATELARYADAARAAGKSCENRFDALTR